MKMIPDFVMIRLISGQCVQSLVQRNKRGSSCGNKDLKEKLVPYSERKKMPPPGIARGRPLGTADSEGRSGQVRE
jgi:hypothetical protein